MFIVFEGLDGSGSTTQARLLWERLEKNQRAAHLTKEPTDEGHIGKLIREVLQHKWEMSPEGLQLMFSADRAEHLKTMIEPALKNGEIVISDRYIFSTIAYGSLAVDDIDWLKGLNSHFRQADLTFLLKLDPEECLKRIAGRGSEFELFEKDEKLRKIWKQYAKLAKENDNVIVIDASKSIEEIHEQVWEKVSSSI